MYMKQYMYCTVPADKSIKWFGGNFGRYANFKVGLSNFVQHLFCNMGMENLVTSSLFHSDHASKVIQPRLFSL